MEKRQKRSIAIRFNTPQEAINLSIQIELKYFIAKLLFSHNKYN